MPISELKLERAKEALGRARAEHADMFVRRLADITLLVLARALATEKAPNELLKENFNQLAGHLNELAGLRDRPLDQYERSLIFWTFFCVCVAVQASVLLGGGYGQAEVELRKFLDVERASFADDEKFRVDYLLNGIGRQLISGEIERAHREIDSKAQAAASPLAAENEKARNSLARLEEVEDRARQLEKLLEGQTQSLNFIGLSKGFQRLSEGTRAAKATPLLWLRICAGALLAAPLLSLALRFGWKTDSLDWWQIAIPMGAIEIVLLFFFRVLLLRMRSLDAQLLQMDVRFALCAFIEEYASFAERIRKSPEDRTLDKFEALIFSGITPEPEKVPNQFDGFEQVLKLLRAARGAEK